MTMTHVPAPTTARAALVALAHHDLAAAMALVVPFVLHHPEEAAVLSELAVVAAATGDEDAAFRAGVRTLFRVAVSDAP